MTSGHILAIESSCDETAAAVVGFGDGGINIKSNIIASQIELHSLYGGVVPEIASRKHIECVSQVAERSLTEASVTFADISAVAVTYAPGLVGALLVGVSYGKSLAFALKKPLISVHHIEGHICANFISFPDLKPPFVCLVASGGHSSVVLVKDYDKYEVMAVTTDDAPGEAFDKISRVLGLGYPGGPAMQKAAENGRCDAFNFPRVQFNDSMNFSFSGVKTAVINTVHQYSQSGEEIPVNDVAASFQLAVCEVLSQRLAACARAVGAKKIALAGGVASNSLLRKLCADEANKCGFEFYCPQPVLCTDNAAMIGARACFDLKKGRFSSSDLNAAANKPLGDI